MIIRQLTEIDRIVQSILQKHGQGKPIGVLRKKKEISPGLFDFSE
jgi:hypothetical protein